MTQITQTLKKLQLNDKEVKVYLSLIQSGPTSVQNISKATGISRATVYQRLENLKKQGLIFLEFGKTGKVVRAVHPAEIKELIKGRVEKSQKLSSDFEQILPELALMYQPISAKAKILHFEGIEGIQRMISNYEMEAKNTNLYGFTTTNIVKILGNKFIKKYHKKFLKKGYKDHFIMSDNKKNRDYFKWVKNYKLYKAKRIFVRKLPENIFNPKVNVAIYDDIYSITLMKQGKPFGVLIQNQEMAEHQLEMFKILWKMAETV